MIHNDLLISLAKDDCSKWSKDKLGDVCLAYFATNTKKGESTECFDRPGKREVSSEVERRQQASRGVCLPVNQEGAGISNERINFLTVVESAIQLPSGVV